MSQHSIVHIEIPATDPAAASKFYADLFDWKLQVDPTFNYHMFQADPGPGTGIRPRDEQNEGRSQPSESSPESTSATSPASRA